jgi:D-3-phosphoglycerate dehydrogenase
VTVRFFDEAAVTFLKAHGCNVIVADLPPGRPDTTLSKEELFQLLKDVDAWILGSVPVTRELLQAFPRLHIIARRGVGFDKIDLDAAKELGRVVTVGRGGNEASVADYTLALMLALGRHMCQYGERMRAGNWGVLKGTELYRKTIGLVGLGRIGRAVAQRLKGFEAKVLAYDEYPDCAYAGAQNIALVDFPELLRSSDYISLHAPLTATSRNMINAAAFAEMKPTAFLINAARAELVDEVALLDALRNKRIAGAGLDVFLGEHDSAHRARAEELRSLSNVVLTPHAAGSTFEGLARGNQSAAESVITVLEGGSPAKDCVLVDGRQPGGTNQQEERTGIGL